MTITPQKLATVGNSLAPDTVWQVPDSFRGVYSHAFEVPAGARLLFVSGQFGISPDGSLGSDFSAQCAEAMNNVERLLMDAGMSVNNLVKLTFLLVRPEDSEALVKLRKQRWSFVEPPSVTAYTITALAKPEYLIEIEAVAAAE